MAEKFFSRNHRSLFANNLCLTHREKLCPESLWVFKHYAHLIGERESEGEKKSNNDIVFKVIMRRIMISALSQPASAAKASNV